MPKPQTLGLETWLQRIDAAEKRGRFTVDDQGDAMNWPSCALSEHRGKYREQGDLADGRPVGGKIGGLGRAFGWAVHRNDITVARRTYNNIQAYFRRAKR